MLTLIICNFVDNYHSVYYYHDYDASRETFFFFLVSKVMHMILGTKDGNTRESITYLTSIPTTTILGNIEMLRQTLLQPSLSLP